MKSKKKINRHDSMRATFILLIIMIATFAGLLFNKVNYNNSTYVNIDYIRSFMKQPGELNDFSNKINMKDPEKDIKWFLEDGIVTIEYGRIVMEWPYEAFLSEDNKVLMSQIAFTFEEVTNKKGETELKIYYCGKEVERHSR